MDISEKQVKKCRDCLLESNLDNFYYNKKNDLYSLSCKKCTCQRVKNYNNQNKLIKLGILPKKKTVLEIDVTNGEKKCSHCNNIQKLDNFYFVKSTNKYNNICIKCAKSKNNNEYNKNINKKKEYSLNRYYKIKENPEEFQKYKEKKKKRWINRIKTDFIFKLNHEMTRCLGQTITDKNRKKWQELTNYTAETLKKHLESQFQMGMTWENHGKGRGKWHIDHIVPKSYFKYNSYKDKEFKICWSLKNLRPLWSEDNHHKHAKLPEKHIMEEILNQNI